MFPNDNYMEPSGCKIWNLFMLENCKVTKINNTIFIHDIEAYVVWNIKKNITLFLCVISIHCVSHVNFVFATKTMLSFKKFITNQFFSKKFGICDNSNISFTCAFTQKDWHEK